METLKVKLFKQTGDQRFYELSHKLQTGYCRIFKTPVNISDMLEIEIKTIKKEYREFLPTDGTDFVCVSDAFTHKERLVFAAMRGEGLKPSPLMGVVIEGSYTMMIEGGNAASMKPDYVYFRSLARLNNLKFTLNDFETNSD